MKKYEEYADLRTVYTDSLIEIAQDNKNLLVLEADLMAAAGTAPFKEKFPKQHINIGIAEANMVGVASGLSASGFVPFANTFGSFAMRRTYDQFFLSANYAQQNVKLVGLDPGITAAFNGGTHMPFEDIALACAIPNLVVIESSDTVTTHKLIKEAYKHKGSVYIRLHRKGAVTRYKADQEVKIGKGIVIQDGRDVAIFATGMVMVEEAIKAGEILTKKGLSVAIIDMHTIKPLDKELVTKYAKSSRLLVSCENGRSSGGLGSAISEIISDDPTTPLLRVGSDDRFGEVGTLDYLKKQFRLDAKSISDRVLVRLASIK